jgi:RNase P subunit RPR2
VIDRAWLLLAVVLLSGGVALLALWMGGRDDAVPPVVIDRARPPRDDWRWFAALDRGAGRVLHPGPLSPAHAHLEGALACDQCHGDRAAVPDPRCLGCHGEIALRAERRIPYHGLLEGRCASCHPEHGGKERLVVSLDRDAFAHARTRFELRGAHQRLECEACHQLAGTGSEARFQYQGVPHAACTSCHRDPHGGGPREPALHPLVRAALDEGEGGAQREGTPAPSLDAEHPIAGRDCAPCHAEEGFGSAALVAGAFRHDADTRYRLEGKHAGVTCAACHTAERREHEVAAGLAPGRAASRHCGDCHQDPHRGALGGVERCESCHAPTHWDDAFDHEADTRFALDPLHASLSCESCHADRRYRAEGTTCEACHGRAADLLAGRFERSVGPADVHHGAVACADCHGPTRPENTPAALAKACSSCHDAGYASLRATWRARLDQLALDAARSAPADRAQRGERVEALRRSGPHNFPFASDLLLHMSPPRE